MNHTCKKCFKTCTTKEMKIDLIICKACDSAKAKDYYERNKERRKEYAKQRYQQCKRRYEKGLLNEKRKEEKGE